MPKNTSINVGGDTANPQAGMPLEQANNETMRSAEVNETFEVSYSPFEVKGDDRYHYFWASTRRNHPQNYQIMKRLGYEIVPENSSEETPFAENKDGGRIVDDLILMRMSKERAEKLRQHRAEAYRRRLSQYEEEMTAFAQNVDGVTLITEPSERTSFYFPNNPLAKK